MSQKRTSNAIVDAPGASDGHPQAPPAPLGARQGVAPTTARWGGYQQTCSVLNFPSRRDPRLDELRGLQLGDTWIGVAEIIGFDQFIAVWRLLTSSNAWLDEGHRVYLPSFRKYLRLQRNLLIEALLSDGQTSADIRAHVKRTLGEDIDLPHFRKIVAKIRMSP